MNYGGNTEAKWAIDRRGERHRVGFCGEHLFNLRELRLAGAI